MAVIHPKPTGNEVLLVPDKVIMSKTDHKGVIQYVNDYFIEICGYNQDELIGKPHNIIRHPDMPKVIFKTMWQKLHKGENLYAIVKNLTKDGSYYWVVTKFETTYDEHGKIISHYARRKSVPTEVRETAESIYKIILDIEKYDVELAEKTFYEILEKYGLTYDDLFLGIAGMTESEISDYFLSSEQNTNTLSENILFEIDSAKTDSIENINEDIIPLENTEIKRTYIEKVEAEIKKEKPKKSNGFLGDISELDEEIKSFFKSKNPLK